MRTSWWWRRWRTTGGASTASPSGRAWGSPPCARGPPAWAESSKSRADPAGARTSPSGFPWGTVLQLIYVNNALPHGVDHRLGPVEDVQLPVDVRGVVSDGLLRDA